MREHTFEELSRELFGEEIISEQQEFKEREFKDINSEEACPTNEDLLKIPEQFHKEYVHLHGVVLASQYEVLLPNSESITVKRYEKGTLFKIDAIPNKNDTRPGEDCVKVLAPDGTMFWIPHTYFEVGDLNNPNDASGEDKEMKLLAIVDEKYISPLQRVEVEYELKEEEDLRGKLDGIRLNPVELGKLWKKIRNSELKSLISTYIPGDVGVVDSNMSYIQKKYYRNCIKIKTGEDENINWFPIDWVAEIVGIKIENKNNEVIAEEKRETLHLIKELGIIDTRPKYLMY